MSDTVIALLAIVLYFAGASMLAARLLRGPDLSTSAKHRGLIVGYGAVILHGVVLYHRLFTAYGLNLGFFNAASSIAWLMALLLLVAALTRPLENLGIAILPLAAITLGLDSVFSVQHPVFAGSPWELSAHIVLSLLAYSLFGIAALQALVLAVQERHLRDHRPGGFIRALPPLQIMEQLLFQMLYAGFVLLSLALLTGIIFLDDIFAQHLVHKTVLSAAAWLIFGILLWGRWRFGWRGRVAIRWTLSGFAVLVLAYFGTKLVLELVLGRTPTL